MTVPTQPEEFGTGFVQDGDHATYDMRVVDCAIRLWEILDDIDTAMDAWKVRDDKFTRWLTAKLKQRFECATSDGFDLVWQVGLNEPEDV